MKILRTIAVLLPLVAVACGGRDPGRQQADPVSPTPVGVRAGAATDDRSTPQNAGVAVADVPVPLPPEGGAETNVIVFPPRNESFAFGQDLEVLYRDTLRRSATLTFVDLEGAVVWIQEYLRYRLNGCSHLEAVTRVFLQIEGFGIQPVCSIFEFPFPPRNEPFDFYNLLELEYRDFLRRSQIPTFTDGEGKLVWIQEYLRYRVSGCSHLEARQKVIDQILGRGVQPDCSRAGLTFTGTVEAFGFQGHSFEIADNGRLTARLTWPNASIDLDLYLTNANCNGYPPTDCNILEASAGVGTNVEQIMRNVFRGEQYTVWVDSFDLTRSSTYQIDLSLAATILTEATRGIEDRGLVQANLSRKPRGAGKVR